MTISNPVGVLTAIEQLLGREHRSTQDFLQLVLTEAIKLIPSDYGFIGLVTSQTGRRSVVVRDRFKQIVGAVAGKRHWARLRKVRQLWVGGPELPPRERSFTGYVAQLKKPRRTGNVTGQACYRNTNKKTQSEIAVPVVLDGDVLAVVNLESHHPDFYKEEDQTVLLLVSRLIARPLYQMMVREGYRSSWKDVLYQVKSAGIRRDILEIATVLDADALILYLYDHGRSQFQTPPLWLGVREPRMMYGALTPDTLPWRLITRRTHYWRDVQRLASATRPLSGRSGAVRRFAVREQIKSTAAVRLDVGQIPVGVFFVNYRTPQQFDLPQREHIETVAAQLAFAVELSRMSGKMQLLASGEETEYLAYDLHDGVAATLKLALAGCNQARARLRDGHATTLRDLLLVERAVKHALGELLGVMALLVGRPLERYGLVGALRREAEGIWDAAGVKVVLPRHRIALPASMEAHLYRIIQTAVDNAVQHGRARRVRVTIRRNERAVETSIEDDGTGFDVEAILSPRQDHYGLRSIHGRAQAMGGDVEITSRLREGCKIYVRVPLVETAQDGGSADGAE